MKAEAGMEIEEVEITPEELIELGREWQQMMLAEMSPEERLAGLEPEEVLPYFTLEERLAGLEPEERLASLEPEEIEAYLRKLKSGGQHRKFP